MSTAVRREKRGTVYAWYISPNTDPPDRQMSIRSLPHTYILLKNISFPVHATLLQGPARGSSPPSGTLSCCHPIDRCWPGYHSLKSFHWPMADARIFYVTGRTHTRALMTDKPHPQGRCSASAPAPQRWPPLSPLSPLSLLSPPGPRPQSTAATTPSHTKWSPLPTSRRPWFSISFSLALQQRFQQVMFVPFANTNIIKSSEE